jgi:hypothetical protein
MKSLLVKQLGTIVKDHMPNSSLKKEELGIIIIIFFQYPNFYKCGFLALLPIGKFTGNK